MKKKLIKLLKEFEKPNLIDYGYTDRSITVSEYPECCAITILDGFWIDSYWDMCITMKAISDSIDEDFDYTFQDFKNLSRTDILQLKFEIFKIIVRTCSTTIVEGVVCKQDQTDFYNLIKKVRFEDRSKKTFHFKSNDGKRDLLKFQFIKK